MDVGERNVITVTRALMATPFVKRELERLRSQWMLYYSEERAVIRYAGSSVVLQPVEWVEEAHIGARVLYLLPSSATCVDVVLERPSHDLSSLESAPVGDHEGSPGAAAFNKWAFLLVGRLNGISEIRARRPSEKQKRQALDLADRILEPLPVY